MHSVSVLVDGDNVQGEHADDILSIASKYGKLDVVRVYFDAQRKSKWHDTAHFSPRHAGTGKNAADILLALDALELFLSQDFNCFVIASSDGDFRHIATRLREKGAMVIGIGEKKAPAPFRAACSEFVELGAPANALLNAQIHTMIAEHGVNGVAMRIVDLGSKMSSQHGVKISAYHAKNWRG